MTEIESVSITVSDVAKSASFFRQTMQLATALDGSSAEIRIGSSSLLLTEGPSADAAHHLAFEIADIEFDAAQRWLSERAVLLRGKDGQLAIEGTGGWNSRSLYFAGPDRMVLELIARRRRTHPAVPAPFDGSHLLNINEVGIGVDDVAIAAAQASSAPRLPSFGFNSENFHPLGDESGLLIFVTAGRSWTPDHRQVSGKLPVAVRLRSGTEETTVAFN